VLENTLKSKRDIINIRNWESEDIIHSLKSVKRVVALALVFLVIIFVYGVYNLLKPKYLEVVKTTDISISKIMKRINQIYAQYFNKKYNYIGHLFQDRYHSEIIKDTAQMLTTTSYIHLNPVRASMVNRPEEYEYSSYVCTLVKKKRG
jgi:succinate dehydrogenase hydrophobic anchor subunit